MDIEKQVELDKSKDGQIHLPFFLSPVANTLHTKESKLAHYYKSMSFKLNIKEKVKSIQLFVEF